MDTSKSLYNPSETVMLLVKVMTAETQTQIKTNYLYFKHNEKL